MITDTDTGTGSNAMTGARRLFHTPVIGAVATPRADLLAAAAAVAVQRGLVLRRELAVSVEPELGAAVA